MWFAQRTFTFEIPSYFQNSFDFFFREVQVANEIAASKIGLHINSLLVYIFIFFALSGASR